MPEFNIITTATLRPEILKRTFDSFCNNLFQDHIKDASLIINIDRVGCFEDEKQSRFQEILGYISELGFKNIHVNCPDNPSFAKAFYWLTSQIDNDLVFNLEEDWELVTAIDFNEMLREFKNNKDLVHLRLSAFDSQPDKLKQWNKWIPRNSRYYAIPQDLKGVIGWCGHPSLNRGSFLKHFNGVIDPWKNPEKQIKGDQPIILNSDFGVWQAQNDKATIRDIGRQWMQDNGYQKKGDKAFFTEWEKIGGQ